MLGKSSFLGSVFANSSTVVNFGGGSVGSFSGALLNVAKWLQPVSTEVGWLGKFSDPNGYPSGTFGSNVTSLVTWDFGYYGHYVLSWNGQGGFQAGPGLPMLVYSGANGSGVSVSNVSPSASGTSGNTLTTSATAGCSVEFAFGLLIGAVSTSAGGDNGGAGLVKFTTSGLNYFGNLSDGQQLQINFATGLPASGPNFDGSWTVNKINNNNFSLQGSSAYAGGVSINTSGTVGVNTEALLAGQGNVVLLSGTYSGFSNLVLCKKTDLTDIQNGKLATQGIVNAFVATKASYLRFMDLIGVQTIHGISSFSDRTIPSSLMWGGASCPHGYWAGQLTNTADAFTCSNPSSSPASGAYVDGEVVVAQVGALGQNTTQVPTLQIAGRTGAVAAPIYDTFGNFFNLTMSGSVPATGTTISIVFTGGGLASSFTYHYLTSTLVNGPNGIKDTSFGNIAGNIAADINGNVRGNSGALVTANITGISASISGAQLSFYYNRNINSSGAAQLNAGMAITASDNGSGTTYTLGFMPAAYLANSNYVTFTYSALLGGWISTPWGTNGGAQMGGVRGGPPLEWCEEVCTRANAGLWYNFGITASSSVIYNTVLHIAQSGVKSLVCEFSNETWNFSESQWRPCQNLGGSLGFFSGGHNSYTGLRTIQMAQQAVQAWSDAGRSRSDLKIATAYQFVDMNTAGSTPTAQYRFNGGELNASGTGTNVTLKAYGGPAATAISTNYSAAPNRPVDWSDWVSPAPYWLGGQYCSGNGGHDINTGVPLSAYDGALVAAYNYAYGTSTEKQAALDFLFNISSGAGDLYDGTLNGSPNDAFRVASWAAGSGSGAAGYYGIGTVAASYDSSRSSPGTSGGAQPKLGVACYEGGWCMGPLPGDNIASDLTGLGYTNGHSSGLAGATVNSQPPGGLPAGDTAAVAAQNLINLLSNWKSDPRARNLTTKFLSQFRSAVNVVSARDALPAWYGFQGLGDFSLYPAPVSQAAPFQAVAALAQFQ